MEKKAETGEREEEEINVESCVVYEQAAAAGP